MDKLYNPLKLSEYRHLFPSKQVLVVGGGAVGSNVAEDVVKMGASVDVIDFDTFTHKLSQYPLNFSTLSQKCEYF